MDYVFEKEQGYSPDVAKCRLVSLDIVISVRPFDLFIFLIYFEILKYCIL